jgi:hypothetical protein
LLKKNIVKERCRCSLLIFKLATGDVIDIEAKEGSNAYVPWMSGDET